jgi:hypothetical protein
VKYQFKKAVCNKCNRETTLELIAYMMASGAFHYRWWCNECDWLAFGGNNISKEKLISAGVALDKLRVIPCADAPRCVKCGKRGAELHHWLPRAIDPNNCEYWPKDYLCKTCHDEWHLKVTPYLVRKDHP